MQDTCVCGRVTVSTTNVYNSCLLIIIVTMILCREVMGRLRVGRRWARRQHRSLASNKDTYTSVVYFESQLSFQSHCLEMWPVEFLLNARETRGEHYLFIGEGCTPLVCGGQRSTCRGRFSPSTMWFLGMKLRSVGLVISTFTC